MKHFFLTITYLLLITGSFAQSNWNFAHQSPLNPSSDTTKAVFYPDSLNKNSEGIWDFSSLTISPEEPVISRLQTSSGETLLIEGATTFRFNPQADGNYFSGWEDGEKTVTLQQAYNKLPYPLPLNTPYTQNYNATGYYTSGNINTRITGHYNLEVISTGTLLLPDTRPLCAATLVKSIEHYHETSCNTTEVHIEKYLWYVPYYPLPVFVAVETAYSYSGGGSDTLRHAYYTANAMPTPTITAGNDTTICLGREAQITASGIGHLSIRNATLNTPFSAFAGTLTVQPAQSTMYVLRSTDEQCHSTPAYDTVHITIEAPAQLQLLCRDTTICETAPVSLRATSNHNIQWYETAGDNHLYELTDLTAIPSQTTRYVAKTTNTVCPAATAEIQVTVLPVPEPLFITIQSGNEVIFHITNIMVKGYTYDYDFGDHSMARNLSYHLHNYTNPGSYTATLKVEDIRNGCQRSMSKEITIDPDNKPEFIFYPNPVDYIANVIAPDVILHYRVIEAATGYLYLEGKLNGTENGIQIDMQSLHPGAYILQIQSGNNLLNHIFIKAK